MQLAAVQTQLFHERRQCPRESVDEFAQELRKLFSNAYSRSTRGGPEAEALGQSMLSNQFVVGLRPELKTKMVGMEGGFEELLMKARFEEAKNREVTAIKTSGGHPHSSWGKKPGGTMAEERRKPLGKPNGLKGTTSATLGEVLPTTSLKFGKKCFNCGMEGHMARACTYPRQMRGDHEARGRRYPGTGTVTVIQSGKKPLNERIEDLRKELHALEVAGAVEQTSGTMSTVEAEGECEVSGARLGPAVFAAVGVNGVETKALVDTGSPATIVSLDFVMTVFARQRKREVTPAQWREETIKKFSVPDVTLKGYGGQRVDIISQVPLSLSRDDCMVDAVVLVQKKPPHNLLLGTDLQSKLGFALVVDRKFDLLTNQPYDVAGEEQQLTDGVPAPQSNGNPNRDANLETSTQRGKRLGMVSGGSKGISGEGMVGSTADGQTHLGATPSRMGEVSLLQTMKIPAGYKKMIRVSVRGEVEESLLLFSPTMEDERLRLADGAVECGRGRCTTLVVENHSTEKLTLKRGTILGTVTAVDEVMQTLDGGKGLRGNVVEDGEEITPGDDGVVHRLVPGSEADGWRVRQLFEQLELSSEHLTPTQQQQLREFLTGFADVFALDPSELGTTSIIRHAINTGDQPPIRHPVRRMPFALRATVDELVSDMLAQGVIEPSTSPWASPVVLVKKKDGTMRFCVDYRRLNQVTKLDEFPLPRIDDTLDLLAGAKYFTTLDMASGYWQVAMEPSAKEKTAFATYSGLYEFRKMPFGLVNAPATFQRLMEAVLAGLARDGVLVYLDDVLVVGSTLEEHNQKLATVFQRIRDAGLRLKPKKCRFAQEEVEYLGHVVSADGVRTDPRKVDAVRNFPTPVDVKTLRSFVGLASYYRRFVPGFSKIAGPLHALTKKDAPFVWSEACEVSFTKLKDQLTTAPVLAFPNFREPFILETDASGAGLGAVLAQKQEDGSVRPVAYASRSLLRHESNYGITELEGLGVVWAAKHFRPYLYGHSGVVYTDHEALKSLLNTPQPSGKLARWGMALQELDLTILHRSGKANANADALSRCPQPTLDATELALPNQVVGNLSAEETEDLPAMQRSDPELRCVITYLETGVLPEEEKLARRVALTRSQYVIEDNVLYKLEGDGTLRVIPPTPLRSQIFQEAHGGRFGAHLSAVKVYSELRRHFWWDGMRGDITRWSRACWCVLHTALDGRSDPLSLRSLSPDPLIVLELTSFNFPSQERGTSTQWFSSTTSQSGLRSLRYPTSHQPPSLDSSWRRS